MGTGYTRNDAANNIADGNIINASDLDGEFDAVEAAFNSTTGHTHDGTSAEGAPIEVIGPTQDVVITASVMRPKTTNTVDLGTSSLEFKDAYFDGTITTDALTVTAGITSDTVTISSDNAGAAKGPQLDIFRDSASPADSDVLGYIDFSGKDDGDNKTIYASILAEAADVTDTTEDGVLKFNTMVAGSDTTTMTITESKVGIGTSSPASLVHLEGDTPVITLRDDSTYSAGTGPYIQFQGLDSGGTNRNFAQIYGLSNGSNSGDLAFYTRDSGTTAERMRISADGNIGLGETNPTADIHMTKTGSSDFSEIIFDSNRSGSNELLGRLRWYWNGTEVSKIDGLAGTDTSNKDDGLLRFLTRKSGSALAEAMRISEDGNVGIKATAPVSYASAQAVLYIEDDTSPAIAISDTGQAKDWYMVAQGTGLHFNYADGSNTGSASNVTKTLELSHGGDGAIFNDGGENRDFRVESDGNANMLFVDANEDSVSVGTSSTSVSALNVFSSGANTAAIAARGNGSANGMTLLGDLYTDDENQITLGVGYANANGVLARGCKPHNSQTNAFLSSQDTYNVRPAALVVRDGGITVYSTTSLATTTTNSAVTLYNYLDMNTDETIFNEDSLNRDFRVESDSDSHMFFIDAGENAIGIGDTAPRDSSWGNATDTRQLSIEANAFSVLHLKATDTTTRWAMGAGAGKLFAAYDDVNAAHHLVHSSVESVFNEDSNDIDFRVESNGNANMLTVDGGNNLVSFGKFGGNSTVYGGYFSAASSGFFHQVLTNTTSDSTSANLFINRQSSDGQLIQFRHADSVEGNISVSGSTVSYNGFSGRHESSGIPTNTPIGTVVSTIDELDVYPDTTVDLEGNTVAHNKAGQTRADHAKVEVSGSEGDPCVYGVVSEFDGDGKLIVTSVGIGSIRVTGACAKGDLLESNGDGTAKVQSDDIIRSKTIGKVTIGNSNTGVKLVSCVMYCG